MNINPTLLFIIGEIIIVTILFSMGIYVATHMKKTPKSSRQHS